MAITPTSSTRARGANARAIGAFETTPGTVPASGGGWFGLPFVSHSLGEERPLIASDLLGYGREMQDPVPDVATNDGDIVVPVDVRNFGRWLTLFFGTPTTTGDAGSGYSHAFASGAQALPSMAIEIGAPEVPAFSVHRGARGNQLRIAQSRSGLLNATLSLICIGETPNTTTSAGPANAASLPVTRFPQATGFVKRGSTALGSVVGSDFTYSNNLEKVESITADGRIEDSDPGMASITGSVTVRFKDNDLLGAATDGSPIALSFGWQIDAKTSLVFATPRVFLPRPKRPVTGPSGIQAQFNFQASGANGPCVTATLLNNVSSYA